MLRNNRLGELFYASIRRSPFFAAKMKLDRGLS
jgi:hypothetical protein